MSVELSLIYYDHLTVARVRVYQHASLKDKDRLEDMIPVVEDWYSKVHGKCSCYIGYLAT